MFTFLEWVLSRAALDPDAFSCAIIVALLMLAMVTTAVVVLIGNILYIKLWRHFRRKKQRR